MFTLSRHEEFSLGAASLGEIFAGRGHPGKSFRWERPAWEEFSLGAATLGRVFAGSCVLTLTNSHPIEMASGGIKGASEFKNGDQVLLGKMRLQTKTLQEMQNRHINIQVVEFEFDNDATVASYTHALLDSTIHIPGTIQIPGRIPCLSKSQLSRCLLYVDFILTSLFRQFRAQFRWPTDSYVQMAYRFLPIGINAQRFAREIAQQNESKNEIAKKRQVLLGYIIQAPDARFSERNA